MEDTVKHDTSGGTNSFKWLLGAALAIGAWGVLYGQLQSFADALVRLLGIDAHSLFGDAMAFFLFETPKVILLLTLIVFVMGVIQSFVSPERTRSLLSGKNWVSAM